MRDRETKHIKLTETTHYITKMASCLSHDTGFQIITSMNTVHYIFALTYILSWRQSNLKYL